MRTARGKGLTPGRVMRRHAIPAASAPVISLVGVTMGTLITNAILLEYTFSIPGMFSLMTQALGNADLPVIEGVAIAGALLVVLANLDGRRRARVAGPARAHALAPGRQGSRRPNALEEAWEPAFDKPVPDRPRDGQSAVVTGPGCARGRARRRRSRRPAGASARCRRGR